MASVLPTHSAHLICLDDQYDEDIYSSNRIPTVNGSSAVPRGPGLGYEVDESEIRRMALQTGSSIPRHLGSIRWRCRMVVQNTMARATLAPTN